MARLFLSYGRRDGAEFADRLAADLAAAGHLPFLDRRALRLGHAWDETLAAALDEAEALLAVLTPHAVRRAGDGTADGQDSVCLDEIARARRLGKPVLPLMVLPCDPPLTLERAHYLDFTGWQGSEARYRARLEELLARLAGAEPAPAPLPAGTAWDFARRIAEGAAGFTGRDWVFARIAAWRDGADPRPLLILGEPGIGKSSLLAELLRRDRGTRVLAAHFFQAELPATRDPARFVRDFAGAIAAGLPAYAAALRAPGLAADRAPAAIAADPASAFERLLAIPLAGLTPPAQPLLVVVDGLDEARAGATAGAASAADLLRDWDRRLPSWLRLLATSRPEPAALRGFENARRLQLSAADPRNLADLEAWLATHLSGPQAAPTAALLRARSAGNFLYAREALAAFAAEPGFDPASLPPGLAGLYGRFFERSFPSERDYAPARAVLGALCAAREPLGETALAAIAGLDPPAARATFDRLAGYLRPIGAGLALTHKALADWLTDPAAGDARFLLDPAAGERALLAWCREWERAPAAYKFRHLAAHLAWAGERGALAALLAHGRFAAAKAAAGAAKGPANGPGQGAAPAEGFGLAALLAADWAELAAAHLAAGEDVAAAALLAGADGARAGAIAAAIARADLPRPRLASLIGRLARLGTGSGHGHRAALALAAEAGIAAPLLAGAEAGASEIRAAAVGALHRLWQRDREAGWQAFATLASRLPGWFGLPRGRVLEVFGGASLALLSREADDAAALARLGLLWRDAARRMTSSGLVRIAGRRRLLRLIRPLLLALFARQPPYQPFNERELRACFARPPAARAAALALLPALEHPASGPAPVLEVLCGAALPFDIHLMLAAERALVVQGGRDAAATLAALERLHQEGPAWFHQSILYAAFHTLAGATRPESALVERYAVLAETILGESRALLATESGRYELIPHLAWPEEVMIRHHPAGLGRFLPRFLAEAEAAGDLGFARRAIATAGILAFAYRREREALALLRPAIASAGPALLAPLAATLADLRRNAPEAVDGLLAQAGRDDLQAAVAASAPAVAAADFPTWVDAFFNYLLLHDEAFRHATAEALRRAAAARSVAEVTDQLIDWVVGMIAGLRVVEE